AACRRALELNPRLAQGWSTLGVVLQDGGRTGEALDAHQRALSLDPANPAIPRNLGVALRDAGRYEEARDAYRRALALAPSYADAHINYAMLSLALGEYDEGWRSYRYRPARVQAVAAREKLAAGLPAEVGGRTILLLGEQGIGDELFFLRFAPSLKERGARLGCQCDRKIGTLLARTGIFDVVCDHEEARPPAQLEVLVGDLPLAPRRSGPLVAPLRLGALDARVEAMRRRLAGLGPAPYLGLTWRAGTPLSEQRRVRDRSLYKEIPLELLARAVADFPGTILVLQRHPRAQEPGRLQQALGRAVHDVSPANEDLEDMLALLSLVDEYVGVSNTNMHLMAGLGRSARVLVPHPPEWRWMARGDASPWFPGFPVYRQQGGDWADALARLAGDLRRSLASRP
ncbi:MAG: tetratricopeptide repeat protein, partial [Betaproteobacteria bacterium]|nr:tetratricopeptide repeat protein [Betaproteobacteria bacterium]